MLHVPRRNELAFLDVHRTPGERGGHNQIGLAAKKRGNLQDIDNFGHGGNVDGLMHVGEHGNMHFIFDFFQNAQTFFDTRPAIAPDRGAVCFVVRGFEDEGKIQRTHDAFDDLRHAQGVIFAFDHARARDQEQVTRAHANVIDLEG